MTKEREAVRKRYMDELREKMMDAPFKPEKFGDPDSLKEISDSLLRHGVVSIALFNGDYSAICISLSILFQNLTHSVPVNEILCRQGDGICMLRNSCTPPAW
jgi:hypothetical protein